MLAVLPPAQAIVVYTDREVHGAVGSRVTLHCSFWSSEWVSDDISFTWRYQPEGGRDAISVSARVLGLQSGYGALENLTKENSGQGRGPVLSHGPGVGEASDNLCHPD